ncbi:collagen alpha-1(I) chain-like [Canis lupus familiaris]|uniref:collagen alpha-1(I) chain-like n=1 Tax=Canis lupus familiaris TaxID=9615 RepID=UPI0018F2B508|nr:collagen alpha-1(I) chain-like [Canis lupus familiaris]
MAFSVCPDCQPRLSLPTGLRGLGENQETPRQQTEVLCQRHMMSSQARRSLSVRAPTARPCTSAEIHTDPSPGESRPSPLASCTATFCPGPTSSPTQAPGSNTGSGEPSGGGGHSPPEHLPSPQPCLAEEEEGCNQSPRTAGDTSSPCRCPGLAQEHKPSGKFSLERGTRARPPTAGLFNGQPGPQHSSQGPASGTCTHQALLPPWGRQQHRRHPASDRLFPDLGTGRGGGGRGQGRGARPPPPGAVLASSGAQGWPTQRALPGSLLPPALRLEVALGAWGQAALTNGPQRVPGTLEGLPGGCPAPAPSWPGEALQVCPLCGWLQAQPGLRAAAPPGGWGAASVTTAGTGPLTALGPRNDPRALLGMPVPPSGARAPGKRSWPGVPTEDMWQSQRKDGALTPGVGGLGRTRDRRCPHRSPGPSPTPPHPRSQGAVTPGLDAPHPALSPPRDPQVTAVAPHVQRPRSEARTGRREAAPTSGSGRRPAEQGRAAGATSGSSPTRTAMQDFAGCSRSGAAAHLWLRRFRYEAFGAVGATSRGSPVACASRSCPDFDMRAPPLLGARGPQPGFAHNSSKTATATPPAGAPPWPRRALAPVPCWAGAAGVPNGEWQAMPPGLAAADTGAGDPQESAALREDPSHQRSRPAEPEALATRLTLRGQRSGGSAQHGQVARSGRPTGPEVSNHCPQGAPHKRSQLPRCLRATARAVEPGPQHSSQGPASGTCTHQALLPPWGRQQHRRHPASDRLFPDLGTGRGGGGRGQGRGARPPPPGAVLASSGAQGWPTQRALPGSLLPPALRLEVALGAWGQAALTNGPQRVPGTLEGLPGGCPAPAPSWPGDALQVCPLCGWLQAQPGLRAAAPPGGWGAASVTTAGTGPLTALGPRNDPRALLGMPVPPSGARAPGKRSWPGVPTEDMWQSQRKDGALTPGVGGLGRTRDWRCPHRSPGPSPTPPHPRSQGAVTPGLDAPHHGSQPPERPTGDSRGPTRPASPL